MSGKRRRRRRTGSLRGGQFGVQTLNPWLFQGMRSVLLRTPWGSNRSHFLCYLKMCQESFLLRSQIMSSYHRVPTNNLHYFFPTQSTNSSLKQKEIVGQDLRHNTILKLPGMLFLDLQCKLKCRGNPPKTQRYQDNDVCFWFQLALGLFFCCCHGHTASSSFILVLLKCFQVTHSKRGVEACLFSYGWAPIISTGHWLLSEH